LAGQIGELNREELRANAGRAVHPQPIVGKQFGKCLIARCRFRGFSEQLIAAFAIPSES